MKKKHPFILPAIDSSYTADKVLHLYRELARKSYDFLKFLSVERGYDDYVACYHITRSDKKRFKLDLRIEREGDMIIVDVPRAVRARGGVSHIQEIRRKEIFDAQKEESIKAILDIYIEFEKALYQIGGLRHESLNPSFLITYEAHRDYNDAKLRLYKNFRFMTVYSDGFGQFDVDLQALSRETISYTSPLWRISVSDSHRYLSIPAENKNQALRIAYKIYHGYFSSIKKEKDNNKYICVISEKEAFENNAYLLSLT